MHRVPELLAPAGNLEKLKVAVSYGADAVYLGGQKFGLRVAADNFTTAELREGVEFAKQNGTAVFVVLNGFLHDLDLSELPTFLRQLEQLKIDAVIVSDLGVIKVVRDNCSIPIHLSTQASCLNSEAAKLWKRTGVTRVVLGREVTLGQAKKIKQASGLEVEMFVHGSMCMAYSGNCVISNYTLGRDSNRGGCAHSCRFEYELDFGESKVQNFFMSSKDLNGLELLPQYIEAGIDSIKIEGRMKGHLYAGTVTRAYRQYLDSYTRNNSVSTQEVIELAKELTKVSHREYTSASLLEAAGSESIYHDRDSELGEYSAAGFIVEVVPGEFMIMEVRKAFNRGDTLEVLPFRGTSREIANVTPLSISGEALERTKPGMLVRLPYMTGVERWNLIRGNFEREQAEQQEARL